LAVNTPITVVMENHHTGTLPLTCKGIEVSAQNVVVSAVKRSEDGEGYVVRAYECDGKTTSATICVKGLDAIDGQFAPHEVKTFFFKNGIWEEVLFTEYQE